MSAALSGVRDKIKRAEQHRDEFKAALKAGLSRTTVDVGRIETHADGKHAYGTVTTPDPPPGVSVQVGDAVHNLRSALDHLICQLAIAAGNPGACDKTQFPVFAEDTSDNRKRIDRWLKHVSPAAQTAIHALQPYKRRPADPTSDLLWILSELDNIDKHRLLLVVNPKIADVVFTVTIGDESQSFTVSNNPEWSPMKLRSIPFRLTIPNDPTKAETEVKVKADASTGVVFSQTGLKCDEMPVFPALRDMIADVRAIVDDFEKAFFAEI